MTAVIRETNQIPRGVPKKDFEKSLERIYEQVRWMDQKLTIKINGSISEQFQYQQNELRYLEILIESMKKTV